MRYNLDHSPKLANELERLEALNRLNVLDTEREERFDRITRLTTQLLQCKFSTISLIDADRQWFKSTVNVDMEETPRDQAFCAHTIAESHYLVVSDTLKDKRFANNPFVTDEPKFVSTQGEYHD